jgi:hypothetical protein
MYIHSIYMKCIVQLYNVLSWSSRWTLWEYFNLQEAITRKPCFRRPMLRKYLFFVLLCRCTFCRFRCIFFMHPVCRLYVWVFTAVMVSEDTLGRIIICSVPLKCLSLLVWMGVSTARCHEARRLETVLWIVVRDL